MVSRVALALADMQFRVSSCADGKQMYFDGEPCAVVTMRLQYGL